MEKHLIKRTPLRDYIFILTFFVVFAALAFLFPISGDDYGWASDFGERLLARGFSCYNGRYLGNLLVILLARLKYLAPLVKSFVLSSIIWMIYKISEPRYSQTLYLTTALCIFVGQMFRQVYAWTSGFANYVPPVLLLLIYFYHAKHCFYNSDFRSKAFHYIVAVFTGLSAQLFMEHMTIYCLVVSVFFAVYHRIKFKKHSPLLITYFCSFTLGAIIMFTNTAYLSILSKKDGYRSFVSGNSMLSDICKCVLKKLCTQASELLCKCCYFSIAAVCVLCIILVIKSESKHSVFKRAMLCLGFSLVIAVQPLCCIINFPKAGYLNLPVVLLFLALLITVIFKFLTIKASEIRLMFFISSILFLFGILLFVSPIGPRCFFIHHIFMILIAVEIFNNIMNHDENVKLLKLPIKKIIGIVCLALLVIAMVKLFKVYSDITTVNIKREMYVEQMNNKGEKTIVIPHLPHGYYIWYADPFTDNSQPLNAKFCDYYDLPHDVEFKYIPYMDWIEMINLE